MKYHLEKVIDAMEQRQGKEDWDIRRDAIEYLKQYKADLEKKCSNCKNWHGHGSYDPKDSLDEVIKANECCNHGEPDSRCEDCPYNGIGACCAERESDALHHLKEYQRYQNTPSRIGHMAMVDLEDNPALTWDELREMENKPIFIIHDSYVYDYYPKKAWFILFEVVDSEEKEALRCNNLFWFSRKDQGLHWQAYRKGR